MDKPQVDIGLPVYNGENYLTAAIDSILAQSYCNFRLIIADNASTDGTAAIGRRYAAKDLRVEYHRQPRNLGAHTNFNFCLERAVAPLFKWAAHDDLLHPQYLEACVAMLERERDAILCHSITRIEHANGRLLELYDPSCLDLGSLSVVERVGGRLRARHCVEVFGVVRTDALRAVGGLETYIGSDRALLFELALKGRFATVPEPLFVNREHDERCSRIMRDGDRQQLVSWYDTRPNRRHQVSTWLLFATYLRLINRDVDRLGDRLRCYARLLRASGMQRNLQRLLIEPLTFVDPRAIKVAKSVKRALRIGRLGQLRRESS